MRTDFGNISCAYKHLTTACVNFHEVLQKLAEARLPDDMLSEYMKAYAHLRRETVAIPRKWRTLTDERAVAYMLALSCMVRRIRNVVERVAFTVEFGNEEDATLIENALFDDIADLVGNLAAAEKHLSDALVLIHSKGGGD